MKLPDHLCNTYARYKQCQEAVICYLVETANGLTRNAHSSQRNASVDTITLRDLVRTAEIVCSGNNFTRTPDHILKSLADVIDLRERCFRWFKSNTHQADTETRTLNTQHAHTISVLKVVLTILRGGAKTSSTKENIPKTEDAIEVTFNKYAALHLDETTDEAQEASSGAHVEDIKHRSEQNKLKQQILDARLAEQEEQEYVLARFCLLEDQQAMVDHLFFRMCNAAVTGESWLSIAALANFIVDRADYLESELHKDMDDNDDWKFKVLFFRRMKYAGHLMGNSLLRMHVTMTERLKYAIVARLSKQTSLALFDYLTEGPERVLDRKELTRDIKTYSTADPAFSLDWNRPTYFCGTESDRACLEGHYVARLLELTNDEVTFSFNIFRNGRALRRLTAMRDQEDAVLLLDKNAACFVPSFLALSLHIEFLAQIVLGSDVTTECRVFNSSANQLQHAATAAKLAAYQHARMLDMPSHSIHSSGTVHADVYKFAWASVPKSSDMAIRLAKAASDRPIIGPIMCIGNALILSTTYLIAPVGTLDAAGLLSMAGLMWQLFQLEHVDLPEWPDLHFLLNRLGEEIVFHGQRPNSKAKLHACGRHIQGLSSTKSKATFNAATLALVHGHMPHQSYRDRKKRFDLKQIPLSAFISNHMLAEDDNNSCESGAVIPELLAYGGPLQELAGRPRVQPQFNSHEELVVHFSNQAIFWKARNKLPTLEPTELIATIAKQLDSELSLCTFSFVKFEAALEGLAESIWQACQCSERKSNPLEAATTEQKLSFVLGSLISNVTAKVNSADGKAYQYQLKVVREVFSEWLKKNGSIGISSPGVFQMQKSNLRKLSPDVVSHVQDIVNIRGLQEGIFTPEQCKEMDVEVTYNLEDRIKEKWKNFRKGT